MSFTGRGLNQTIDGKMSRQGRMRVAQKSISGNLKETYFIQFLKHIH